MAEKERPKKKDKKANEPDKSKRSRPRRKKNEPEQATKPRRRRRRNPDARGALTAKALGGDAMAIGAGAAVGALAGGMDKSLAPDLVASSPKRGGLDLAIGVGAGLGLAIAGAPAAGHGAMGAGAALMAKRLVDDFGRNPKEQGDINAAVLARMAEREKANGNGTAPTPGAQASQAAAQQMVQFSSRPRIIPQAPGIAGALPAANGAPMVTTERAASRVVK